MLLIEAINALVVFASSLIAYRMLFLADSKFAWVTKDSVRSHVVHFSTDVYLSVKKLTRKHFKNHFILHLAEFQKINLQ